MIKTALYFLTFFLLVFISAAVSVSTVSAAPSCPPGRNETISGSVKVGGSGIDSAQVTVTNYGNFSATTTVFTDSNGNYSVDGVACIGPNDTAGDGYRVKLTVPNGYTVSPSGGIYDHQIANGNPDCWTGCNFTLTQTALLTNTDCQNADSSGHGSIQQMTVNGVLIQACHNTWLNAPDSSLGPAYVNGQGGGIYLTNNGNSPNNASWDYKEFLCDGTGLSRQGYLGCSNTDVGARNGVIVANFSAGSIAPGETSVINDAYRQNLQSGRINGTTKSCGSAQVVLYNFGGTSNTSNVLWGYTDALNVCPQGVGVGDGSGGWTGGGGGGGAAGKPNVTCSGSISGQTVTWTANTVGGNGTDYSYSWSGDVSGAGTTSADLLSNTISQTYSCSTNCTKNASVTVTSGGSASNPGTCQVNIVPPPIVTLSATPVNITNGTGITNAVWTTSNAPNGCTYTNSGDTSDIVPANAWTNNSSTTGGNQNITLTNVSGSPHSITFSVACRNSANSTVNRSATVTIQPVGGSTFDFSLTDPNPNSITPGGTPSTTSTTITKSGSPTENVTLSIDPNGTQLPTPATASFTNNPCTTASCTSALSVTTNGAPEGNYPGILIRGVSSITGITHVSGPFTLVITPSGGVAIGTPWIQTVGGDVHSNLGIETPGGP